MHCDCTYVHLCRGTLQQIKRDHLQTTLQRSKGLQINIKRLTYSLTTNKLLRRSNYARITEHITRNNKNIIVNTKWYTPTNQTQSLTRTDLLQNKCKQRVFRCMNHAHARQHASQSTPKKYITKDLHANDRLQERCHANQVQPAQNDT